MESLLSPDQIQKLALLRHPSVDTRLAIMSITLAVDNNPFSHIDTDYEKAINRILLDIRLAEIVGGSSEVLKYVCTTYCNSYVYGIWLYERAMEKRKEAYTYIEKLLHNGPIICYPNHWTMYEDSVAILYDSNWSPQCSVRLPTDIDGLIASIHRMKAIADVPVEVKSGKSPCEVPEKEPVPMTNRKVLLYISAPPPPKYAHWVKTFTKMLEAKLRDKGVQLLVASQPTDSSSGDVSIWFSLSLSNVLQYYANNTKSKKIGEKLAHCWKDGSLTVFVDDSPKNKASSSVSIELDLDWSDVRASSYRLSAMVVDIVRAIMDAIG